MGILDGNIHEKIFFIMIEVVNYLNTIRDFLKHVIFFKSYIHTYLPLLTREELQQIPGDFYNLLFFCENPDGRCRAIASFV